MKQLLQNCGKRIIVGLNNTVYYGSGDVFIELLAPTASASADDDNKIEVMMMCPLEVQAVAVTTTTAEPGNAVWCAVARYDKTLALYKLTGTETSVEPHAVHKTLKRVSTMSFASVHGKAADDGITVIVTGDLAGDATAFPLEISEGHIPESSEEREEEITKNRRLLLGHTASMLTSVHVVATENPVTKIRTERILTSDRDEKIRVSSFPATYCIDGFLLGHKAFVSSVAVSPKTGRCVSVGGDDTLRLWDFTICQELAVATTSESNSNEQHDGKLEAEGTGPQPVPSKVAMRADGDIIVAICDNSKYLDLWKVRPVTASSSISGGAPDEVNDSDIELHRCLRFECNAQPLAVAFVGGDTLMVVMCEPEYIQAFTVAHDEQVGLSIKADNSYAFCDSVRKAATAKSIVMPDRLLEKDEWGCLKMQKMNEKRSGATLKPWNNAAKRETDKERIKRLRKRRRDEYELEKNDQDAEADNSS